MSEPCPTHAAEQRITNDADFQKVVQRRMRECRGCNPHLPPLRRTAALVVNAREIERLLNLPEGYRVVGIEAHQDPVSFLVVVQGDDLAEVPDNAASPRLWPQIEADGSRSWVKPW